MQLAAKRRRRKVRWVVLGFVAFYILWCMVTSASFTRREVEQYPYGMEVRAVAFNGICPSIGMQGAITRPARSHLDSADSTSAENGQTDDADEPKPNVWVERTLLGQAIVAGAVVLTAIVMIPFVRRAARRPSDPARVEPRYGRRALVYGILAWVGGFLVSGLFGFVTVLVMSVGSVHEGAGAGGAVDFSAELWFTCMVIGGFAVEGVFALAGLMFGILGLVRPSQSRGAAGAGLALSALWLLFKLVPVAAFAGMAFLVSTDAT